MKHVTLLGVMVACWLAYAAESAHAEFDASDPHYCLTCHGAAGQGNPKIEAPLLAGMSSWYLKNQLKSFRAGWRGAVEADTTGAEMYAIARVMNDQDIERAVAFIAALPARSDNAEVVGDIAAGRQVYARCAACHSDNAEGNAGMSAPALAYQQAAYLQRQLHHFRKGVRGADTADVTGAQMRAVSGDLTDDDITNVIAFIKSIDS